MRYAVAIVSGGIVATLLFLLMHALIAGEPELNRDDDLAAQFDFVKVQDEEIENKRDRRKPPEPEKPKEPPPPPKLSQENNDKPPPQLPNIQTPNIDIGVAGDGIWIPGAPGSGNQEGDVVPIFLMQPQYPREAALDGIEGWVKMAFTIEADGSVSDVEILESNPRRIFDRAAKQAMYKSKFKPRVIDGVATARRVSMTTEFKF
ncbi:MAG: energy transducer TonB [Pseudomonadota bacterium]